MQKGKHTWLPWPPSVNHYWLTARGGHRFISPAGVLYRNKAKEIFRKRGFFNDDVVVSMRLYPPDKRIRDIDNILKALFDALVYAGALTDDKWITELHVALAGTRKEPRVMKDGVISLWIRPRFGKVMP